MLWCYFKACHPVQMLSEDLDIFSVFGLNFRIRYIIQSGSDLFLVLNKGFEREEEGDRRSFRTTKTEAVAKLGWTFQF